MSDLIVDASVGIKWFVPAATAEWTQRSEDAIPKEHDPLHFNLAKASGRN